MSAPTSKSFLLTQAKKRQSGLLANYHGAMLVVAFFVGGMAISYEGSIKQMMSFFGVCISGFFAYTFKGRADSIGFYLELANSQNDQELERYKTLQSLEKVTSEKVFRLF